MFIWNLGIKFQAFAKTIQIHFVQNGMQYKSYFRMISNFSYLNSYSKKYKNQLFVGKMIHQFVWVRWTQYTLIERSIIPAEWIKFTTIWSFFHRFCLIWSEIKYVFWIGSFDAWKLVILKRVVWYILHWSDKFWGEKNW